MSLDCSFLLTNTSEIYKSGDVVIGFIKLNLSNPLTIEAIKIELRGHGTVSWNETFKLLNNGGMGETTRQVEYKSSVFYVQIQNEVMLRRRIEESEYILPFNLRLPQNCPSSWENILGSICYNIIVTVTANQRSQNERFKRKITVIKKEDLNQHSEYKIPMQIEKIKKFCWFSCTDAQILFTFTTPFSAYAPLQRMFYTLHMENQSLNEVTGYEIAILQCVTYTANLPEVKKRKEIKEVLNKLYDDKCPRLTNRIFEHFIDIPNLTPSNDSENNDNIIKITYELRIIVMIPGCSLHCTIKMPLHLGSEAIEESLLPTQHLEYNEGIDSSPTAPILPSTSRQIDKPPSYHNFRIVDPPSFSEAIHNGEPPPFAEALTFSAPPYDSTESEERRPIGFILEYPTD